MISIIFLDVPTLKLKIIIIILPTDRPEMKFLYSNPEMKKYGLCSDFVIWVEVLQNFSPVTSSVYKMVRHTLKNPQHLQQDLLTCVGSFSGH